jgi:peptidoglycan/LPS O-acetylase OafA/YrhL
MDDGTGLIPFNMKSPSGFLSSFSSHAKQISARFVYAILPTWLQSNPKNQLDGHRKNHPTAYMDGMRGMVAILVYIRHFSLPWQEHLDYGYGYHGFNGFLRLPYFRVLFAGPLVPIFFIVSGYVLSVKPLRLARKETWEPLVLALAGSAFRRGIRLFLPPIVSTFCVMLLAHFGLFSFSYDKMPGRVPAHAPALEGLGSQFLSWAEFVTFEMINPWRWDVAAMQYGPHLWTIPISFKGSCVVFITCLALLRVKSHARLVLLGLEMAFASSQGRWDMALFISGMMLCELDLRRIHNDKAVLSLSSVASRRTRFLCLSLVLTGLYLGSFPRYNNGGQCVLGYRTCCKITYDYHYWHALGAFMLMGAIARDEALQWPFTLAAMQYFGSISFAIYIIHEPLLHVVGFRTVKVMWSLTGNETTIQYQVGLLFAMVINAVLLVWLADLFKRHVEQACGKVAEYIEKACFFS